MSDRKSTHVATYLEGESLENFLYLVEKSRRTRSQVLCLLVDYAMQNQDARRFIGINDPKTEAAAEPRA